MKITHFLVASLAASGFLFTSCDKKAEEAKTGGTTPAPSATPAVSEKDAVERFKKDMDGLEAHAESLKEASKTDPTVQVTLPSQMMAKMDAISTDGLPADLKDAFVKSREKLKAVVTVLKDVPQEKEAQMAYLKKVMGDADFKARMQAGLKDLKEAGMELNAAGKKHGIDIDITK